MATIRKRGDFQWEVRVRRKGRPTQCNTFELKTDAEHWRGLWKRKWTAALLSHRRRQRKQR